MPELETTVAAVLQELAWAWGHYRIHKDLSRAMSEKARVLVKYHDFFEATILAHFAGVILSISRLLDRHGDSASVHWLLQYIKEHPQDFSMTQSDLEALERRLQTLAVQVKKIRHIRNKRIAHRERQSHKAEQQFWAQVSLTDEDVRELLHGLDSIARKVVAADTSGKLRFIKYAVDEETAELLEDLELVDVQGAENAPNESMHPTAQKPGGG